MSIFPITPLVRQVQSMIVQTFDVSEQAAQDYAAEMVSLAEGWGRPEMAAPLDWTYRIKKDLGETRKLRWRTDEECARFEESQKQKHQAYDTFIRGRHT